MLYSNASMPAAAVQPVVQPRRNSTEIIFRRGTSHNMPEPFRSHEGGTLQFAVVHPAVMQQCNFKEEVYHRLDKGFNFQGIQSLGENALGKSQGVTANNMPSTSAAATAEEPIVIPDDNENVNLVPAGKKLKRKGKSFIHEEAEEEEEDEVPEEVLLRAFTKRKGKGKARA
mmetsp:Transcript_17292/g.43026  ORF Transcript_17292/g.43026 Transcript_17292/m.43026 type:complete len:171 (+) Transcript_17292:197-709(+)